MRFFLKKKKKDSNSLHPKLPIDTSGNDLDPEIEDASSEHITRRDTQSTTTTEPDHTLQLDEEFCFSPLSTVQEMSPMSQVSSPSQILPMSPMSQVSTQSFVTTKSHLSPTSVTSPRSPKVYPMSPLSQVSPKSTVSPTSGETTTVPCSVSITVVAADDKELPDDVSITSSVSRSSSPGRRSASPGRVGLNRKASLIVKTVELEPASVVKCVVSSQAAGGLSPKKKIRVRHTSRYSRRSNSVCTGALERERSDILVYYKLLHSSFGNFRTILVILACLMVIL